MSASCGGKKCSEDNCVCPGRLPIPPGTDPDAVTIRLTIPVHFEHPGYNAVIQLDPDADFPSDFCLDCGAPVPCNVDHVAESFENK